MSTWQYPNYPEWVSSKQGILVDKHFVKTHFSSGGDYGKFVLEYSPDDRIVQKLEKYYLDKS